MSRFFAKLVYICEIEVHQIVEFIHDIGNTLWNVLNSVIRKINSLQFQRTLHRLKNLIELDIRELAIHKSDYLQAIVAVGKQFLQLRDGLLVQQVIGDFDVLGVGKSHALDHFRHAFLHTVVFQ